MNGKNIMNQKGEQGGKVLGDGDSFSKASDGKYATGFTCVADTTLSSIAINYAGATTKYVGVTIVAGSFIAGIVTELTVDAGLVAVHYGEE